jgi:hypothetical protein
MRALPYVIDNDRHRLADIRNQVLADHRDLALDVVTAYFNVRSYGLVANRLKAVDSLRLLLGGQPTEATQLGLRPRAGGMSLERIHHERGASSEDVSPRLASRMSRRLARRPHGGPSLLKAGRRCGYSAGRLTGAGRGVRLVQMFGDVGPGLGRHS